MRNIRLFIPAILLMIIPITLSSCDVKSPEEALLESIEKGHLEDRIANIYALSVDEVNKTFKYLMKSAISDPEEEIRLAAVRRLGDGFFGAYDELPGIYMQTIKDENPAMVISTLKSVNMNGGTPSDEVIKTALQSPHENIRAIASESLFSLVETNPELFGDMIPDLLEDSSMFVRLNAAFAQSWNGTMSDRAITICFEAFEREIRRRKAVGALSLKKDSMLAIEYLMTSSIDKVVTKTTIENVFTEDNIGKDILPILWRDHPNYSLIQQIELYNCPKGILKEFSDDGIATIVPTHENGWEEEEIYFYHNDVIRGAAIGGLINSATEPERYLPRMLELLGESNAHVRQNAVWYIGTHVDINENQDYRDLFIEITQNDDSQMVRQAAEDEIVAADRRKSREVGIK